MKLTKPCGSLLISLFCLTLLTVVSPLYAAGGDFVMRQVNLVPGGEPTWLEAALNSLAADDGGVVATRNVVNMSEGLPGRFGDDAFPDPSDTTGFVVEIQAEIVIGKKDLVTTFNVGSDDGFLLEIEGCEFTAFDEIVPFSGGGAATAIAGNTMFYPHGRSFAESYGVCEFDRPGVYSLRLVFFELAGAAILELSSAQGDQLANLPDVDFQLINDQGARQNDNVIAKGGKK